jgi:hypothetical protein
VEKTVFYPASTTSLNASQVYSRHLDAFLPHYAPALGGTNHYKLRRFLNRRATQALHLSKLSTFSAG